MLAALSQMPEMALGLRQELGPGNGVQGGLWALTPASSRTQGGWAAGAGGGGELVEALAGAEGSKACSPVDSGYPASRRGASASPRGSSPDSGKSLCSVEDWGAKKTIFLQCTQKATLWGRVRGKCQGLYVL